MTSWRLSMLQRLDLLDLLETDIEARSLELEMCRRDPVHFCNRWAVTYDPRDQRLYPFELFPVQERLIRWFQQLESEKSNGLVEKSRDGGATYVACAYALHGWLFRPGFSAGFGSSKLELVDSIGDPDSIFEKLRIMLRNLPWFLLPPRFNLDRDCSEHKLVNRRTGNTITGQGGDNIGRGGRKTIYWVDEFAHVEHPALIDASLSQNTRCRIDMSTPAGPGNAFATKRHSGAIPVFTMHWKDDPRKNAWELRDRTTKAIVDTGNGWGPADIPEGCSIVWPWRVAEHERLQDPVTEAQEIDIDYTASVEGICIPALWVRAAVNLPIPTSGFRRCGFDVAGGGANRNVLIKRHGPVVEHAAGRTDLRTAEAAWWVADEAEAYGARSVSYDGAGLGLTVAETWEGPRVPGQEPRKLKFLPCPVAGNDTPSEVRWPNGRTSQEQFGNLRAELAWMLRTRFQHAHELRLFLQGEEGGVNHAPDTCISIPNHPDLIAQLSMPLVRQNNDRKWFVESKIDMRKRGIKSPDYFDGMLYSEHVATDWGSFNDAMTEARAERVAPQVQTGITVPAQQRREQGERRVPRYDDMSIFG